MSSRIREEPCSRFGSRRLRAAATSTTTTTSTTTLDVESMQCYCYETRMNCYFENKRRRTHPYQYLQDWRWLFIFIILLSYVQSEALLDKTATTTTSTTSTSSRQSRFSPKPSLNKCTRGGALLNPLLLSSSSAVTQSVSHYIRVGLAGGIAGAVGTAVLYPVDTAKTLRQSNPTRYASVRHALMDLIFSNSESSISSTTTHLTSSHSTLPRAIRIQKAYRGVIPATLGAIPSSALYFGAYETCKMLITKQVIMKQQQQQQQQHTTTELQSTTPFSTRLWIHALAAASGNVLSSAVFVPKEFWKQQLQCFGDSKTLWGVVRETMQEHGWRGMYAGYQTTLLRNVPSAILRFALYEEIKWNWYQRCNAAGITTESSSGPRFSPAMFAAGAVSGATASGLMTPVDVVKTRLATRTIPTAGFVNSARYILQQDGIRGLYAGAGSRMVWSGAFSAVGFATFEFAKSLLGVGEKVV